MSWTPPCVICRQQDCVDPAACSRELASLVERTRDRYEDALSEIREERLFRDAVAP